MRAGRVGYMQPPFIRQADGLPLKVNDYRIAAVKDTTPPLAVNCRRPFSFARPSRYPAVTPSSAGYKSWFRISPSKVRKSRISTP